MNGTSFMRFIYFTGLDYPSEIATNSQVKSMSKALYAQLGDSFTLIVNTSTNADEFGSFVPLRVGCTWKRLRILYFVWWFIRHARTLAAGDPLTVLYFKDSYLACMAIVLKPFFSYRVVFESHLIYHSVRDTLIAKHADRIVAVTSFLKSAIVQEYGCEETRVLVAPDAVDLALFDIAMTKSEAREHLGLPADKVIFVYTGRFKTLGMDKGISVALEALKLMNEPKFLLVAVGGSTKDLHTYMNEARELGVDESVILRGYVSQSELAIYQKAADALLMPFPHSEHFAYYMSPLKMFEYMASKVPVIASDLPAVRDILDETTALLVKPGSIDSLADAMKKIAYGMRYHEALAPAAYERVKDFTWQKRAGKVIDFVSR